MSRWTRKDLLGLDELSAEEIWHLLDTARAFKGWASEVSKRSRAAGTNLDELFRRAEHAHAHFV